MNAQAPRSPSLLQTLGLEPPSAVIAAALAVLFFVGGASFGFLEDAGKFKLSDTLSLIVVCSFLFFGVVSAGVAAMICEQRGQHGGRKYTRKADTIYGDGRAADDWEIDAALRDNRGGFAPMFKD
jgi:hypothetical protein